VTMHIDKNERGGRLAGINEFVVLEHVNLGVFYRLVILC
jgi:hypothetical protein